MKRNLFNLGFTRLMSFRMGQLVPIGLVEVLPGDTFQHSVSALIRTQQLLAPVMHPVNVRIHHWFVPLRIVWPNFETFITGGATNSDNTVPPHRGVNPGDYGVGTLADYFGLPQNLSTVQTTISALPFRAYAKIWNEFYRDQDLQNPLPIGTGDNVDTTTSNVLQNVAWEKDYFTSSRPWELKGPSITIPLGTEAPVGVKRTDTNNAIETMESSVVPAGAFNTFRRISDNAAYPTDLPIVANLSTASAVTVNAFRQALALQRFAEARARYGSRYTEYLASLGVKSSDQRLQRPEYLGGGKQVIQFSEVLQTSTQFDSNLGVGTLRGHGMGAMRSNRYRRYFEEHGFVISLMSVLPKTMYINGVHKMWSRMTKESYFQKELQFIGQQQVLNREIYGPGPLPAGVFGYQDRYDEYRRMESGVAGEFKTSVLNYWHFARDFATAPALNSAFVTAVPTERTFPAPVNHTLYAMVRHSLKARRILAREGVSRTL